LTKQNNNLKMIALTKAKTRKKEHTMKIPPPGYPAFFSFAKRQMRH